MTSRVLLVLLATLFQLLLSCSPLANDPAAVDSAQSLDVSRPQDVALVEEILAAARSLGDARSGLTVFGQPTAACLSCHKVGRHGGAVGPELTAIATQRSPEQIVESLFWPSREVAPEYVSITVVTTSGELHTGARVQDDPQTLVLRDPSTGSTAKIPKRSIVSLRETGSLMPAGLVDALTREQQIHLVRFLIDTRADGLSIEEINASLDSHHAHAVADFSYERAPLDPSAWPRWRAHVNRDRIYDFYAKEAEHFRRAVHTPRLLPPFPGLDGGTQGHWGNQNEKTWANGHWNETDLGSVLSGVFRGAGVTVSRGVCVRLGDRDELSVCFNPDTLNYDALWKGGFVGFSSVRHGFLDGLRMEGEPFPAPAPSPPRTPFRYRGFYRHGRRVVFAYRIGDVEFLDAPAVKDGKFRRVVAPVDEHPLREMIRGGPPQWPEELETRLEPGSGAPYAVDTIKLPLKNPWNALLSTSAHAFLEDGSALVTTMQGDVWRVSGFARDTEGAAADKEPRATTVRWRRVASGLHHPQGIVVSGGEVFVQGRDQITRLHDLNADGEADFYECFSNAFETSAAGHDFVCGLERDAEGAFYTASGNQGVVRISRDGESAEVIATGLRNPDGLGLLPDGTVTVPASEGGWTPASMVCAFRPAAGAESVPHFGYRGPRDGKPPTLPLAYLPRALDNSSGGQTYVSSELWGPLQGQLVHFSFGAGSHFLLLRDEVEGQLQGAAVPLVGEFLSGAHRGRFHPHDGQLYVTGMGGWGTYGPQNGCFQRVRYTDVPVQLPVGFHVHQNGVRVEFSEPLEGAVSGQESNHFAQCWNYRYSSAYGSPEYSPSHPGTPGHDALRIAGAHVLADGHTLFLELPDLQPVNQLHLLLRVDADRTRELFITVHALDAPYTELPGYRPVAKSIAAHPMLSDLALATKRVPNPWRGLVTPARRVTLRTGKNLSYETRILRARTGEWLELVLENPDVVPHNWALVKPGTLERVGELANRLVADPEAVARHYIPETDDVLVFTDIVAPKKSFTIYFRTPEVAGRYPYLCTFPGHWRVMNGEMVVE